MPQRKFYLNAFILFFTLPYRAGKGNPQFLGYYKGEHYLQNNNKNITIINLQNVFDLQHSIHSHLGFTPTDTEFKLKKTQKDKKKM